MVQKAEPSLRFFRCLDLFGRIVALELLPLDAPVEDVLSNL